MSDAGGPRGGGVVLLYENVKLMVTDGNVQVLVTRADGSVSGTVISQKDGAVVGGSNEPKHD